MLILGRDLVAFLSARRAKNKRTCQPGELYCGRCRAPRAPAGEMVDYVALTATLGNLAAICSVCETIIYRRVSLAKLAHVCGKLDVTMPKALEHIAHRAADCLSLPVYRGSDDRPRLIGSTVGVTVPVLADGNGLVVDDRNRPPAPPNRTQ